MGIYTFSSKETEELFGSLAFFPPVVSNILSWSATTAFLFPLKVLHSFEVLQVPAGISSRAATMVAPGLQNTAEISEQQLGKRSVCARWPPAGGAPRCIAPVPMSPLVFCRKLAGRTLFITGGSRGIGKAIALKAARDGANVVIAAKTAVPHPKLPGTVYTAAQEGGPAEATGAR